VSPETKFLLFAIFVAALITVVLSLLDIPFGWGYSRAAFVLVIAAGLYILLMKIADRIKHRKPSDL